MGLMNRMSESNNNRGAALFRIENKLQIHSILSDLFIIPKKKNMEFLINVVIQWFFFDLSELLSSHN